MSSGWIVYQSRELDTLKTFVELYPQKRVSFTYHSSLQRIIDGSNHAVYDDTIETFDEYKIAFARFKEVIAQKEKDKKDREERAEKDKEQEEERKRIAREKTKEANRKMAEENATKPKQNNNKKNPQEPFALDF